MKTKIMKFFRDENGAAALEYGLVVALVGVALIVALQELGQTLASMYDNIGDALASIAGRMR